MEDRNHTHYPNYYVRDLEKDWRILQLIFYVYGAAFSYLLILVFGGYFLWYCGGEKPWKGRKIQRHFPTLSQNIRDMSSSILSSFIFTLCVAVPLGTKYFQKNGLCDLDVHYSWSYAISSSLLILALHETYFYWSHRLLHTKWLYDHIHYVHHLARNPSPYSVLLLHPIEALMQGIFYTSTFFFIPTTRQHLGIFYFVMHLQDWYVHLGYEIYPANWPRHWLGKWLVTSVAHNLHHSGRKGRGSYSFYTNFWDKLCGTEIKGYPEEYDKLFAVEEEKQEEKVTNGKSE